jgi:predicted metal-dependent hydrolase
MFEKFTNKNVGKIIIIVLIVLLTAAIALCVFFALRSRREAVPAMADGGAPIYAYTEFDPNKPPEVSPIEAEALPEIKPEQLAKLETELAKAHSALEDANADYEDYKIQQEQAIAALKAENSKLASDLPPALNRENIIGKYNGISELATLEYKYSVTFESEPEGNIFTKVERLYIVSGTAKMGVKLGDASKSIVIDNAKKTVTVTVPKAHLFSNELDEQSVQSFDINIGWFASPDDLFAKNAEKAKSAAEKEILNNDMLSYAQRLAGFQLQNLLEPITSVSAYTLVIEYE